MTTTTEGRTFTANPIADAPFDRPTIYEDPWLSATINPIRQFGDNLWWELKWGDRHESWREYFPEYFLAKTRLAELVGLDHEAGDVLSPLKEHFQNFMGHGWHGEYTASKWWDFRTRLKDHGYSSTIFNSGGGILLIQVELLTDSLLVWFDDHEGYPRMGLYAINLDNEVTSDGGMVYWSDSTELDESIADEAARILDQITWAGDAMVRKQIDMARARREDA